MQGGVMKKIVVIGGGQRGVFLHRVAIHVDLPADAAAMAATVGDAGKTGVVFGGVKFHRFLVAVILKKYFRHQTML